MGEVFVLSGIETKMGTKKDGSPWTRYTFKSADGQNLGSTFNAALGAQGQSLVGQPVEVDRTYDGQYHTVTGIKAGTPGAPPAPSAPSPQPAPAAPSGGYFRPRDPAEQVMIRRQVALKAAAQVVTGRDIGSADVLGLAETFDKWLRETPVAPVADEDIPF